MIWLLAIAALFAASLSIFLKMGVFSLARTASQGCNAVLSPAPAHWAQFDLRAAMNLVHSATPIPPWPSCQHRLASVSRVIAQKAVVGKAKAAGVAGADPFLALKTARAALHKSYGELILAVSSVPRYSHVTLADLKDQFLEPLIQERLLIIRAQELSKPKTDDGLLGIVVWASVSEAVDAKIRAKIEIGEFPVRLERSEWNSGNITWLLDVIAPSRKSALRVFEESKKTLSGLTTNVHPNLRVLVSK